MSNKWRRTALRFALRDLAQLALAMAAILLCIAIVAAPFVWIVRNRIIWPVAIAAVLVIILFVFLTVREMYLGIREWLHDLRCEAQEYERRRP